MVLKRTSLLLLAGVYMLLSSSVASAAGFAEPPSISNKEKAHRNIGFTGDGQVGGDSECSETTTNLSGADNFEKIYNYMTGKGLSPEQAAGVLGNIAIESGGNPIRAQVGPDTKDPAQFGTGIGVGKAWGLIQWDAGGRVIDYATRAGATGPIYELGTQLDIVWWHMNNSSPTGAENMYAEYKNITDVSQATQVYEVKMEGAGTPHMEDRILRAKEFLRQYGGGGGGTATPTPSNGGCGPDGGGVASTENFTFPLVTTQKAMLNFKPYPWCSAAMTNCHHDYKAADLMIDTGTVVVAAKDGVVQNVNGGNQHPNNVTITTSDGKGINYYTHMGANTAIVREGQKVSAGDILGKVGTSEDAMGTPPHLHFDMLPPKHKYRPSCSGASCTRYQFIEVQPALIETFNLLPKG